MDGRERGSCDWKKWLRRESLIWVGVVASGREGKQGEDFSRNSFLTVQMELGVAEARRDPSGLLWRPKWH